MMLLTPAYFEQGCYPTSETFRKLPEKVVIPQLQALIVERPQIVSGWSFARKDEKGNLQSGPKPTRRLVPAGSVFFLKLEGKKKFIERWVDAVWFRCIGDDEQLCNDGFGLAVVGTWDGNLQELNVGENEHE